MGDENTDDHEIDESTASGAGDESHEADEGTEGEDHSDEESDAADGDDSSSTKEDEGTKDDDDAEGEDEEDDEPPVRKPRTNADWVKLRKQRKAEREKRSTKEQGDEEQSDDEDDDLSEDDRKVIDKYLDRKLKPVFERETEKEVQSEIDDFVATNPDFKPFAQKAAKWAKNPAWSNVPTEQLMYAVAGKKLLAIGAERRTKAEQKANRTKSGGSQAQRAGGGEKPVAEMTDAEMQAEIDRVKYGSH